MAMPWALAQLRSALGLVLRENFARLNISARLGVGFAALIALATLVVVVGLTRLHTISAELALIRSGRVPTVQQVFDIVENANVVTSELRNALLRDDPAKVAASLAERVAAGDHSSRIAATSHDAIGKLLQALQAMNDKLLTIIVKVRSGSDSIATGSAQIASGNQVLSPRTEEQASSLEQTAASMEQSTATIQQNADNTKQANQLAMGASTVSIRGGEVVGQEIQTMKGINDSRKMIADIISVIDSIASQTTILALNAGAEAVRAPVERRRPDRAESVTRPEFGTKPKAEPPTLRTEAAVAKTGTADSWASL